jgi:dienelactone hydrolase
MTGNQVADSGMVGRMQTERIILAAIAAIAIAGCTSHQTAEPASPGTAQPVAAPETPPQTPIADASALQREEVSYEVGGVTLEGYLVHAADGADGRPGVIVVHEWWGHNDYARRRADMLAELGYTALAVDMYGDGKRAAHPKDAGAFAGEVLGNLEVAEARFRAAMEVLSAHASTDPDKLSAIGYCFGGTVVLQMARAGVELDGVASFHGSLATKTPADKGAVRAQVLVLHGDDDPMVPPAQVAAFKEEMAGAGVDIRFVGYPGATHAFTNPDADENAEKFGLPIAYDRAADEKSWAELERFLAELYPRD